MTGAPPGATASPRATVVVVSWNGAALLPPCLDGLRRQTLPAEQFRVVVVDNASSDGTRELLAERYPEVEVVANDANLGFAGGNNSALRHVTTPFAVLLNNDAVPEPDWLERLLAPFDAPGGDRLGMTTGKVVFLPRFAALHLDVPGFVPGPHDTRELGVRVHRVEVDGRDVTGEVLWEQLTYGREGDPAGPGGTWFWTRPAGRLLVPVPEAGPAEVVLTWAGDRPKQARLSWGDGDGGEAVLDVPGGDPAPAALVLPADAPRVDVVNNAGGVVLTTGYGADRGYQAVDPGDGSSPFDRPAEVFTGCGNGMAVRSSVGHRLGWFDDDFFLYYEDTDLSWRLRLLGWGVRYVPDAVLRHHHAASSGEWSPLFVFHTDRNRLLMLVKDASAPLALAQVPRYALTTASMAVRAARQAAATRNRPAVRPLLLRLRVLRSLLRLLPVMLRRRRAVGRTAAVPRAVAERMLVTHADWQAEIASPAAVLEAAA